MVRSRQNPAMTFRRFHSAGHRGAKRSFGGRESQSPQRARLLARPSGFVRIKLRKVVAKWAMYAECAEPHPLCHARRAPLPRGGRGFISRMLGGLARLGPAFGKGEGAGAEGTPLAF